MLQQNTLQAIAIKNNCKLINAIVTNTMDDVSYDTIEKCYLLRELNGNILLYCHEKNLIIIAKHAIIKNNIFGCVQMQAIPCISQNNIKHAINTFYSMA